MVSGIGEDSTGVGVAAGGVAGSSVASFGGGGADGCSLEGGGAAAAGASLVTLIRQSWSLATTFSPSGMNSSSMTPETGEGTGMDV